MFKGDVDLDTISIRAKNKAEARMIFEDTYRDKYEDKLGDFAIEIYLVKPFPEIDSYASGGVIKAKKVSDWDWGKIFEKVNLGLGQSFVTILPKNPDGGKIKYGLIIRDASNQFDRSSNLSYIFDLDDKYYPNDRQDVKDTISSPYYGKDEYKEIARGSHFLVITIQGNRKTLLKDLIDKVNYTRFSKINRRNETDIPFDYPNRFLYDLLVFEGSISDLVDFVQKLQSAFQYEGAKLYTEPTPYIMSIIWNIPQIIHYDGSVITPATYIPIFELANEVEAKTSKKRKYADGGEVEGVDLFEDYDDQPEEVQAILANYEMEDNDYETLQNLKAELESIGYTMDFGLDAEPYDLRKIGEKGKSEFYAKGGMMADGGMVNRKELNKKIKDWYIKTYPTDKEGKEINDKITFKGFWAYLSQGYNVYDVLQVADSLVRERVFGKLSEIYAVDYDVIYNMWLRSDKYAKGGEMADGGEVEPKIYEINDGFHLYYFYGDNKAQVLKYFKMAYDTNKYEQNISIRIMTGSRLKHLEESEEYNYIEDARVVDNINEGGEMAHGGETDGKYTEYEMVVLSKDADGKSHKYRFLISARNIDEAKQTATDGWHSEFGDMDETFYKVMTDSKYRMEYMTGDGGGVPYKPYGKTKGRFKLTYEIEGEPQSEIRQSLEEAKDSAKRYSSPKLGYTNVHIHDESGKEYFFGDGGETDNSLPDRMAGFFPINLLKDAYVIKEIKYSKDNSLFTDDYTVRDFKNDFPKEYHNVTLDEAYKLIDELNNTKMADGGEVDFIERMAKMRSAYENLNMIVKSKIAMAVGIDRAISIMENDYSIDPFNLITSAVRGGLLELDEINKDLVNEAVYEAENVTDDYRDSGQGISGSDMTAFTKNVLDSAGYKTGFINNRLERVDEEGNKLEIDKYNMNY